MYRRITAAKKEAMRQMRELLPPTYTRLAAICGVHPVTLRELAVREDWPKLNIPRRAVMRYMGPRQLAVYEAMLQAEGGAPGFGPEEATLTADLTDVPPGDIGVLLIAEMRTILASARLGRFDKRRVDALLATIRAAERLGQLNSINDKPDPGQEEQTRSDNELARILKRVDDRIVELARGYAERLVAEQHRASAG